MEMLQKDIIESMLRDALDLPAADGAEPYQALKREIDAVVADYMLVRTRGNKSEAARQLGVNRQTFRKMIRG